MDSKYDWLSYPWIALPSGLIIGFLAGLMSNWFWAKLRSRRKEYFNISYSNNELRFEGQYKTYNPAIFSKNILIEIFKYKPINNKTNYIELDKFFKKELGDSSNKN